MSAKKNPSKKSGSKKPPSNKLKSQKSKKPSLQAQVNKANEITVAVAQASADAVERNFYAGNNTYEVSASDQTIPTKSGLEVAGNDTVRSSVAYNLAGSYAAGGNQIENLVYTGTAGVALQGNALANSIVGGANNDSISGGTGADTLVGGSGNDTLFGNGSSILVGGANDDTYVVGSTTDVINDASGSDEVRSSISYTLGSDIENLTYTGTASATFGGNNGNNYIDASSANTGNAVSLSGNGGRDTLIGGSGNDTLRGAASSSLVGGEGDDAIFAEGTDISIDAGNGNNTIVFSTAAQMKSAATIIGGKSVDTVKVDSKVRLYDADFVNFSGIEKLVLTSNPTDGGNYIELGLLANARSLETAISGTGNDTIDAGAFNSSVTLVGDGGGDNLLIGSAAGDSIYGGTGSETILGNAGNDTISGGGGADSILGGVGDDDIRVSTAAAMLAVATISGGADNDTLKLTSQNQNVDDRNFAKVDSIVTFQVADGVGSTVSIGSSGGNADASGIGFLFGGNGGDTLTGYTDQATTISGNDGNDSIIGGTATDSLLGGVGNDTIAGAGGSDIVLGGAGNDSLFGHTSGAASLSGGDDDDTIVGNGSSDTLDGGAGADSLFGNAVAETLLGGDGNDSIVGGGGVDSILGGDGDDVIEFSTAVLMAAAATIAGGLGTNTVALTTNAQNIGDADFGGFDSINVLELADGANIVEAGATAVTAGIATIVGGANDDSLQVATMTSFTSLIGGLGTNTVALTTNAQNIGDADFGGFDSINVLELADGANIVEAGATALSAGIATIVGGINADRIDIGVDYDGNQAVTLLGGAGDDSLLGRDQADSLVGGDDSDVINGRGGADNMLGGDGTDTLIFATPLDLATAATVIGGLGNDTISIANAGGSVVDTNFDDLDTVEALVFTAGGNCSAILETEAQQAGIVSVFGGVGDDTIDASNAAYNATGLYFQGNGGVDSLVGGGSTDKFVFSTAAALNLAATVSGGNGNDTISLAAHNQTVVDADFTDVLSVEALSFADGTGSSAVLAGTAATAGIAKVYGGNGNDTLTVDETFYSSPLFNGADGVDVLILSNDTATLADSFFTNMLSVDSFQTANGANNLTLGIEASEAGIATVTGGTGDDILNASAMTSAVTLLGGLGADTLTGGSGGSRQQGWTGTSTVNVSSDTLTGGSGTDIFVLGDVSGNAYGFDSNPAVNYRALITGFAMGTDRFQLWDADQSGAVTVAADGTIANQMNISVGGLQVYRFNYDNAADTGTLYVAGTTKVVAELTGFTGSGSNLTGSNFSII
jgi:Ca2+-binding RTX toxin-like protein